MTDTEPWDDNVVQFARLLCEIVAAQDIDIEALCVSMDLNAGDINALFDRADDVWERAKGNRALIAEMPEPVPHGEHTLEPYVLSVAPSIYWRVRNVDGRIVITGCSSERHAARMLHNRLTREDQ